MNKKHLEQITEGMLSGQFSLVLAGNFLNVLKHRLIESGFQGFPVICLYGPGNMGKTATCYAATPSDDVVIDARYGSTAVKKALEANPERYMVLDDICDANGRSYRESLNTMVDRAVRTGFSSTGPIVALTIEEKTYKCMVDSCRQRLLCYNVTGCWNDKEHTLAENLQECRGTLQEVVEEFQIWFEVEQDSYDFVQMRRTFTSKYYEMAKGNTRTINKVFAYTLSLRMFFYYLQSEHYEMFARFEKDLEARITDLIVPFMREEPTDKVRRAELFMEAFQRVLKRKDFVTQNLVIKKECQSYLCGNCYECKGSLMYRFRNDYPYDECYKEKISGYDPFEMILDEGNMALFLDDASKVEAFWPKDQRETGPHPILIVSEAMLLVFLNQELAKTQYALKTVTTEFTSNEVKEMLKSMNMLLYTYGGDRIRYTITHLLKNENGVETYPAFIIRLTKSQAEDLKEAGEAYENEWQFDSKSYKKMISNLRARWGRLRFPAAPIGEYRNS